MHLEMLSPSCVAPELSPGYDVLLLFLGKKKEKNLIYFICGGVALYSTVSTHLHAPFGGSFIGLKVAKEARAAV